MVKVSASNSKSTPEISIIQRFNARWPAWIALIIVAILYEALPAVLYFGPRGLMLGLVIVLTIPMIITFWRPMRITRFFSLAVNILITIYMIDSVFRLVWALVHGYIEPERLLVSAVLLWLANILIFALWYWNLDAGGPGRREENIGQHLHAFLFPQSQIAMVGDNSIPKYILYWTPHFIDYLFLSFNTSAAFSPTDTPILSRWAKCMSMVQASISLTIIVVLAARAINILSPATNYVAG